MADVVDKSSSPAIKEIFDTLVETPNGDRVRSILDS